MSISNGLLLNVIENSVFMFPHLAGVSEHLTFSGTKGRTAPLSHPLANVMGATRLDAHQADTTIRQVYDYFAGQQKAFGWFVGPSARPIDLGKRLAAVGLHKAFEMAGMTLTDLDIPIRSNPAVQIRKVTAEEMLTVSGMVGEAYGLPAEVAQLMTKLIACSGEKLKMHCYLAYVNECQEPVGFSYLFFVPEQPVVVLQGAATLEAYRGQGIYRSFVARRLADARAAGAKAAVIQAVRDTSAPICAKLGFQEICNIDYYAWTPEENGNGEV